MSFFPLIPMNREQVLMAEILSTLVRKRHGFHGRNISNYDCLRFYLHFCMHECLSEFWQVTTVRLEVFNGFSTATKATHI